MRKLALVAVMALGLATSAGAAPIFFQADLTGAAESPQVNTTGNGYTAIFMDTVAHTLRIMVEFQDLIGNTTASHVHCCTAVAGAGNVGVATELPSFTGFPLGVTFGSYDHTFDTSLAATWNPAFLAANGGTAAGAEAAFLAGMLAGRAYLNVHSTFRPGGEIRGFLAVPEPASLALIGLGLTAAAIRRRRSR